MNGAYVAEPGKLLVHCAMCCAASATVGNSLIQRAHAPSFLLLRALAVLCSASPMAQRL
jgi:hypothetical protein